MNKELMQQTLDALIDFSSGWRYIRHSHGDLYGVGWDRAQTKGDSAIAALQAAIDLPVTNESNPSVNKTDVIRMAHEALLITSSGACSHESRESIVPALVNFANLVKAEVTIMKAASPVQPTVIGYTTGITWSENKKMQSEQTIKITRDAQPQYGFTVAIHANPQAAIDPPVQTVNSVLQQALDDIEDCSRLLGTTQAIKIYGSYTDKDARFETIMHKAIGKSRDNIKAIVVKSETNDTEYMDWYEANADLIINLGKNWYWRDDYNQPHHRVSSMRAAIKSAMAAKQQKVLS